jgi:hypothetical protein
MIFGFIAGNVVLYLAFAFVAWEINPANWNSGGRALALVLGAATGILLAAMAVDPKLGETKGPNVFTAGS